MRKLLPTLLTTCAALGLACNAQPQANTEANRAGNTSAVNAPADSTPQTLVGQGQSNRFDEEETALITVRRASGSQNPQTPCEIVIDKERIKLLTDDARGKSKVEWHARNECTENRDRPITVEIQFPKAGPFGADACDKRLMIDFLKRNGRKRFLSKTATAPRGVYKYDIHAYYTGTTQKVANSLDPEIEIGGNSVVQEEGQQ